MKRDTILTKPITSSFLSCEKDTELILKKLFIESRPYSDVLKSLLIIQASDCIDNLQSSVYQEKLKNTSIASMRNDGYIVLEPRIKMNEHDQVKSYLIISFNNFLPNVTNPEFRDCTINFDIVCHIDCWDLGNYRMRPAKIAGYIDGILNKSKLTGIGTLQFAKGEEIIINEDWAGYSLTYWAIHGSDDQIEAESNE